MKQVAGSLIGLCLLCLGLASFHWLTQQHLAGPSQTINAINGLILLCCSIISCGAGMFLLTNAINAIAAVVDASPMIKFPSEEDLLEDRKRFEEWAPETLGLCVERTNVYDNVWVYRDKETQLAWESWKACVRFHRERVSRC